VVTPSPRFLRSLASACLVALFATPTAAQVQLGVFDSQTDIGRARPGSTSYDVPSQQYVIAGSGQNMWGDHDDFHFVWKRMTGNFILTTRAHFIGEGVEAHRKLGWTIRASLDSKAPHVTAALHGDGLASLQFRRTAGATTEEVKSADSLPSRNADALIQLERRDGVYLMSVARFGDTLVSQQLADVSLPDTVYVGLFVCAHNDAAMERGAFSNVRVTVPARRDLVAYREYLGSNLEILDVATGNATVVHQYRGSFQAPNWTRDGKALIYAQEGRLYRFDLAARRADTIDTGFATQNNNDHVLSFDGQMMAISHHAVEDSGRSIIYTVPTGGGTPKRVTAKGPSYFHGWSPDGRWLVYTGQRNNDFDVYRVASNGGEETRLTSAPGLDDGPEYTPDGQYIYFNSARTGKMQIWRMRPDGSGQEQITNDGFNNWFPHISPDGKWIAYLSFGPDVAADQHPFYKHVLLRLMPIGGGPSRVLAYVYGGQGTINVPSWSPDGTRLAFVSNSTVVGTAPSSRFVEQNGQRFRDLNRNGALDPYEDRRLDASARAKDLVARMTLEEKIGMMMHGTARSAGALGMVGVGPGYDTAATGKLIRELGVNSFITRLGGDPTHLAAENNRLQALAEATRLGIPVTISTDPRNHFQYVVGASSQTGRFSQWPETLGLAAIGDAAVVRRFADIARQEYRAVGIQETLSPQADLATEPRWSRINGTFGEDPELARRLVEAYVEGFQHGAMGVDASGVLAVVKHWVGYGAQKSGFDSHSRYGRLADFSGGSLEPHIRPFLGAFAAHVGGVMPTYSILEGGTLNGRPLEQVGAGFNRQLLNDLLRKRYGFQGIVVTDWAVTNDCGELCRNGFPPGQRPTFAGIAMPWGVEDLPKADRFAKAVNAGVDQFGGTEEVEFLLQAVRQGKVSESRINESAYRIALQKFKLGLFDNPYVDTVAAGSIVGNPRFRDEATAAQRRSLVLLENKGDFLPVAARGKRVFLHGVDSAAAVRHGFTVVSDVSQADLAIVRTVAPYQTLHPGYVFGAMQHEGDLGFRDGDPEFEEIKRISAAVPTVLTIYLDRPAILSGVKDRVSALIGNFGVSDDALLDVVTDVARPQGKLPFELPSTMAEVEAQRSARPSDTAHPLYRIHFGRAYKRSTR